MHSPSNFKFIHCVPQRMLEIIINMPVYFASCHPVKNHNIRDKQQKHTQHQGMKQKLWSNGFHWKLDCTASSCVPSLTALQLVEQKLLRSRVSTCEHLFTQEITVTKSVHSVEISNLNNFCSIGCRALKLGTLEDELKPILLINFQLKVQNLFHT